MLHRPVRDALVPARAGWAGDRLELVDEGDDVSAAGEVGRGIVPALADGRERLDAIRLAGSLPTVVERVPLIVLPLHHARGGDLDSAPVILRHDHVAVFAKR